MVDTRTDYSADAVAAARAVMLEMVRLLGEHRDAIVIAATWLGPQRQVVDIVPCVRGLHVG